MWAEGGLLSPRPGLLHQSAGGRGGEEKEETEVAGDAKTRPDAVEDDDDETVVEAGDAATVASASRVSRARLDDLSGTTVEAADSDEVEEDMDEPRRG